MSNSSTLPHEADPHLERRLIRVPPIFLISIAFSIGIWLAHLIWIPFFSVAIIALFALCGLTLHIRAGAFVPLSVLIFFLLGVLFGTNDQLVSRHDLALSAPEGTMVLEGRVVSVPETAVKGRKETVSFVLRAHNFFRLGRLYQTQGKAQVFLHNPGRVIRFGDRLRLRGLLEVPKAKRNPHSFDYADYLARNGITRIFRGIGQFSVASQVGGQGSPFFLAANRFRTFLKSRVEKLFPSPHRELANALVLGFRKNIPRDIQDAFIKTGTAHLIAISGLNISLIGGLFYFLLSLIQIPRAVNLALTIAFIGIYTILAGASLPVLRAGLMGIVILLGFILGHERNLKSALFFAFFVLLIWNPSAFFLASFQLSFVAMASLIFLLPKLEHAFTLVTSEEGSQFHFIPLAKTWRWHLVQWFVRLRRSVFQTFLTSLAATVGMFPILIWYFNLFSVIGFLANVIVIPVCTIGIAATLMVLLLDLIFAPLAQGLAFLPLVFFRFELWLIDAFAKIPIGYVYLPRPSWLFFIFYYGALIAWLFLSHRRVWAWLRRACLILMGLATAIFLIGASPSSPRFVFFDLGKTDSAFLLFSNGANCLINAGRHAPNDQAYWILRPFLMGSGIQKLDSILLTKVDGTHAGGFQTLTQHIQCQKVWIPRESQKTPAWEKYIGSSRFHESRIHSIAEGERVQFGSRSDIYAQVLAISKRQIRALHIADGKNKMLYVASSDRETFRTLSQLPDLDYDFLFLPHHEGGISEEEKAFLKRLSARFIISNERERIAEFRQELKSLTNSEILFLEESGAVEFYESRGRLSYKTFLNPNSRAKVYFAS